jgi:hypothetical protein
MLIGNRKLLLLILLLILLAFSMFSQFTAKTSPSSGSANTLKKIGNQTKSTQDPLLMMDVLQAKKPEYLNEKRNIFAFPAPPPPPAAQMVQQEPLPPVCGDNVCQPGEDPTGCPVDCGPPPPPEIPLRYIGFLQEAEGSVVFLTDGNDVYMGRVNDVIANRYRILKITDESVELGYLSLNQSRTIPFQGNNRS